MRYKGYVQLHGLHIFNRVNGNNDGFHFISCEHVAISNCTMQSQDDACALFGSCKHVTVTNCTFSSAYRPGEGHSCIVLNAVGDSILENITFDNVHLTFGGGGTAEEAARRALPEIAGEYFMLGPMPAYGLYARNARGVTLQNVRFEVAAPDLRPAVIFDHVEDAAINLFSVEGTAQAESVLRFIDSKDVLLTSARVLTPSAAFLQSEGSANARITIDGGDLSRAAKPLAFRDGATERAVKLRA